MNIEPLYCQESSILVVYFLTERLFILPFCHRFYKERAGKSTIMSSKPKAKAPIGKIMEASSRNNYEQEMAGKMTCPTHQVLCKKEDKFFKNASYFVATRKL